MNRMPTENDAIDQVIQTGREAARRGWVPATSGNFSVRAGRRIAITRSGCDKGNLTGDDVALVDLSQPLPDGLSAEAPLHAARYRANPAIGAIFHVHSFNAALASRLHESSGEILLQGWELQKAFAGATTHEDPVRVPVFANRQDTTSLATDIEAALRLSASPFQAPGYLLSGHGLYAWGATAAEAARHLDAFDALLALSLAWTRRMD
jgi:methylthioribulose-1-phosphate dehydratase